VAKANTAEKAEKTKRTRRTFGEAEKRAVIREILEAGAGMGSSIAAKHGIAPNVIYRWKDQYEATVKTEMEMERAIASDQQIKTDDQTTESLLVQFKQLKQVLADRLLAERLAQ